MTATSNPIFSKLSNRITYAVFFFDHGVGVAPCQPYSKDYIFGYGPHKGGLKTHDDLIAWFQDRQANYALLTGTGQPNRYLSIIDFDDLQVYELWKIQNRQWADTFTVYSARGCHVYFWTQDCRSWSGKGFEVMGQGKAVMGPLSIHPSGAIYTPTGQPIIKTIKTISDFSLLSKQIPERKITRQEPKSESQDDVIRLIKSVWNVYDVIQSWNDFPRMKNGEKLKTSDNGRGRWFVGRCPFHGDNNPSFWIDTQRNLFGCHSCQAKGDVINLVANLNGWQVSETIKFMARGIHDR